MNSCLKGNPYKTDVAKPRFVYSQVGCQGSASRCGEDLPVCGEGCPWTGFGGVTPSSGT